MQVNTPGSWVGAFLGHGQRGPPSLQGAESRLPWVGLCSSPCLASSSSDLRSPLPCQVSVNSLPIIPFAQILIPGAALGNPPPPRSYLTILHLNNRTLGAFGGTIL